MNKTIGVTVASFLVGTTLIGCGVAKGGPQSVTANGSNVAANTAASIQIGGGDTPTTNDSKASSVSTSNQSKTSKEQTSGGNKQSSSNAVAASAEANQSGSANSATVTIASGNSNNSNNSTYTSTSANTIPTTPATSKVGVELSVTTNFGSQSLFGKRLAYNDGDAVMDILDGNLDVETAYGGGFVSAINGVKSADTGSRAAKAKKDWFYWVNGSIAAIGANDYMLKQGDDVWWDYHAWDGSTGIPAVIGQYPHPFTTGYSGVKKKTTIFYGAGEQAVAQQLQAALRKQGADSVDCKPYSDQAIGSISENVVVVGINSDLLTHSILQSTANGGVKHGEYIQLSAHSYTTLEEDGTKAGTYGAGNGAIMAVGSGSGDTAPVWLVTGVDQTGLQAAVSTLTEHPSSIYHTISCIVSNSGVRNVPSHA